MTRIARTRSTILLTLGLVGCAQVLGLEDATLDTTGSGAAGSAPSSRPTVMVRTNSCYEEPLPGCARCLQDTCAGALGDCLGDPSCWLELDTYAYCLGDRCDGPQEDCSFALDPPPLQSCVQTCETQCAGTKLLSECELYCGCMAQTCPEESVGDCMTACVSKPAEVTACQRDHCKMAANSSEESRRLEHCEHASGRAHVCLDKSELSDADRTVCTSGAESTWACNADDDCCSEQCVGGACR